MNANIHPLFQQLVNVRELFQLRKSAMHFGGVTRETMQLLHFLNSRKMLPDRASLHYPGVEEKRRDCWQEAKVSCLNDLIFLKYKVTCGQFGSFYS